ncbi:hypothetical protein HY837_01595 [archaeon]|nr:hypothetical protein [archaeon]
MIKKLISGSIISTAFLSSSYAQEVQQEKFNSVVQLEETYKSQVRESLSDGFLSHEEIVSLDKLLKNNSEIIEEKESYDYAKEFFEHPLKDLLRKYPGLFDENTNAVYLADQKLNNEEKEELISKIQDEKVLQYFNNKENLTLQDLAVAYTSIESRHNTDNVFLAKILRKQQPFFRNYFESYDNCKDSWFNTRPYLSIGILPFFTIRKEYKGKYSDSGESLVNVLGEYVQIRNAKINTFEKEFPDFYKFNALNFSIILCSLFGPLILRDQIKKYRKDEKWTDNESNYHLFDIFLLGVLGIESIHHSITYLRFAVPVVWETFKGLKK